MLSIVIPVLNEAESLVQLHDELVKVASANNYELDIVFVDDGSTDGSWSVIEKLTESDRQVRVFLFRRNFGNASALSSGFS